MSSKTFFPFMQVSAAILFGFWMESLVAGAFVAATVPVRISRYLRDHLMKIYKEDRVCIPRQLLVLLDPEMAQKYPNVPANRGDRNY